MRVRVYGLAGLAGRGRVFLRLGSVTQLERHLREQAALGTRQNFSFYWRGTCSRNMPVLMSREMVEALHFAEKAAAKDYLPAVSLVAEIHLSKPNLSKAESGQYMAEMISALEAGLC